MCVMGGNKEGFETKRYFSVTSDIGLTLNSTLTSEKLFYGVPLLLLHQNGVHPNSMFFWEAEFLDFRLFGKQIMERNNKIYSGAVSNNL
jgi:hypothetical protein